MFMLVHILPWSPVFLLILLCDIIPLLPISLSLISLQTHTPTPFLYIESGCSMYKYYPAFETQLRFLLFYVVATDIPWSEAQVMCHMPPEYISWCQGPGICFSMSLTLTTGPGLGEAHKIPDKCMNGAEAGGGGSASVGEKKQRGGDWRSLDEPNEYRTDRFSCHRQQNSFPKAEHSYATLEKKIQILLLTLVTSSYQCSTSVPLSTLLIKSHVRYARVSCWAPPLCPEGAVRSTASLSQRPYLSQFHHSALLQSLVNLVHILNDACTVLDVCI